MTVGELIEELHHGVVAAKWTKNSKVMIEGRDDDDDGEAGGCEPLAAGYMQITRAYRMLP